MSTHIAAPKGAIAESILLPGDPLRAKFIAENFLQDAKQYNEVRGMLGYTGTYKGVPVSVQGTGMGMPSMGIYSWELMTEYGVQNLVRVGTTGSYQKEVEIRDILVILAASTDSNYAQNFDAPGNYAPAASYELIKKVQSASDDLGVAFKAGTIFSTDVFYDLREVPKKWAALGVLGVDMETAALYTNAAYNKRNALSILTVSDNLVTGEVTTAEERQKSFTEMMKLGLETVIR